MTEIWKLSGLQLGKRIASKEIKPSEVMQAILARIEKVNPEINAFCTVAHDSAMAEARAADEQVVRGTARGPLFGVPVSIKDLIETRGLRTTFGSLHFEKNVPAADAVLVERLRGACCPILGKTNTPEFGGKFATDNTLFGTSRNPWNLQKSPGGSSGGAASQVAAGLGPLAVGNDGGGSIRVPSSCCGVYGLKPQFGRIPSWPRHDSWSTLNHEGPITRTVRDAAAMLDILAGPDERDRTSLPASRVNYLKACEGDIKGLKVAWSPDLGYGKVDPEVREICQKAVRAFEEMGCVVEEAHPGIPCPDQIFLNLIVPRMVVWLERELPENFQEKMDPMLTVFLPLMNAMSARDVIRAIFSSEALWDKLSVFFRKYDLLLTPTLATPPYELGIFGPRQVAGEGVSPLLPFFTFPFNLTGQPAASIPAGFTKDGLPVGLQIVGRRYDESTVLRASACFEEARPWAQRWPSISYEKGGD